MSKPLNKLVDKEINKYLDINARISLWALPLVCNLKIGATTLSIMKLSIMTFSIMSIVMLSDFYAERHLGCVSRISLFC
jgi:hypothetical protein